MQRRTARRTLAISALLLAFAPGALAAEQVQITWGVRPYSANWDRYISGVIDAFEKLHPDITVKHFPLVDNWTDKMTAMMATQSAPDVFEMWGSFARKWAQGGLLLDLSPLVERDFTAADIKDFVPAQWQGSALADKAHPSARYGLPSYANVMVDMFQTDLFEQGGLETPQALYARGDWNWTTFLSAAKKLTLRDGAKVIQWGYKPRIEGGRWAPWVWGNGGRITNWPEHPNQVLIDQTAAVDGLTFLRDLVQTQRVAPAQEWGDDFPSGKFGLGDGWGSCCLIDVEQAVKDQFKWNIVPVPQGPVAAVPVVFNGMWGAWSGTKHPQATWEFLKFLTSREGMELYTRLGRVQPARLSLLSASKETFPGLNIQLAVKSAEISRIEPATNLDQNADKVMGALESAIIKSVYGDKPMNAAINEIAPQLQTLLQS